MENQNETFGQYIERIWNNYRLPGAIWADNDYNSVMLSIPCNGGVNHVYSVDNFRLSEPSKPHWIEDANYYLRHAETMIRQDFEGVSDCLAAFNKNPYDIVKNFGCNSNKLQFRHRSEKIEQYIFDMLNAKIGAERVKALQENTQESCDRASLNIRALKYWKGVVSNNFNLFQFAPSTEFHGQISFYENKAKYDADRRTAAKPAKALKRLVPFMTDDDCSAFSAWFKEECAPIEYRVLQSNTREGFRHAYSHERSRSNDFDGFRGGIDVKPLEVSCMRHDASYWGQEIHPAESYASGDFKIIWAEDNAGKIAARVTVYIGKGKYVPAPIYSLSNNATDEILDCLKTEGWNADSCSRDWNGAKLLKLETSTNYYAIAYNDMSSHAEDMGEYFQISSDGGVQLTTTAGHTFSRGGFSCHCESCGEGLTEDEMQWDSENEETICENCYNERFTSCHNCREHFPVNNAVSVYVSSWRSREYCPDCAADHAVECHVSGYMVSTDSVTWIESEDAYIADWELDNHYFLSDISGEYMPIKEKHELPNGAWATLAEIRGKGQYDINETETDLGVEYSFTLKDWLEVDCYGSVINRQLNLPLAA